MAKKNNFEDNMKELESIVNLMDEDEMSLDDTLKNFEKGVDLYEKCKEQLEKIENKISILKDKYKKES